MARAAASRRPADGSSSLEERAELLHGLMSELCLAAVTFVSQAKLEETTCRKNSSTLVRFDLAALYVIDLDIAFTVGVPHKLRKSHWTSLGFSLTPTG